MIKDIIGELDSSRRIKKIKETFLVDYFEMKGKLVLNIGCKNSKGQVVDNYSFQSNEEGFIHPGQVIEQLATAWDIAIEEEKRIRKKS